MLRPLDVSSLFQALCLKVPYSGGVFAAALAPSRESHRPQPSRTSLRQVMCQHGRQYDQHHMGTFFAAASTSMQGSNPQFCIANAGGRSAATDGILRRFVMTNLFYLHTHSPLEHIIPIAPHTTTGRQLFAEYASMGMRSCSPQQRTA